MLTARIDNGDDTNEQDKLGSRMPLVLYALARAILLESSPGYGNYAEMSIHVRLFEYIHQLISVNVAT